MTEKSSARVGNEVSQQRPVMVLIDLMGKKWVLRILWELHQGPCTFRELQNRCGDISPTIINKRVKELITMNLVTKAEPSGYLLTKYGEELIDLFHPLNAWAKKWSKTIS